MRKQKTLVQSQSVVPLILSLILSLIALANFILIQNTQLQTIFLAPYTVLHEISDRPEEWATIPVLLFLCSLFQYVSNIASLLESTQMCWDINRIVLFPKPLFVYLVTYMTEQMISSFDAFTIICKL